MYEAYFILYESASVATFALVTGVTSGSDTGDENDDDYELHVYTCSHEHTQHLLRTTIVKVPSF